MRGELAPESAPGYWEAVGGAWASTHRDELWRRCSDAIHARWLDRVAGDLPPGRVLKTDLFDEAYGDGLAPWFESHGHDLVACDLALTTARGAVRKPTRVVAAVADVRQLPFSAMAFDIVFSDSTLDHFEAEPDIRRALAELGRVLRPGGTLLLTMDNPTNPLVRIRNRAPAFWMRLGVVPYAVGATCDAGCLGRWLREAGFDHVATETIMHLPRVLAVPACRWLSARGTRRPGARMLQWLLVAERLRTSPLHGLAGHFVAAVARRSA
jgi:SAM-dependent methyltransferase